MFSGRLIPDGPHSGVFNMAADLYLAGLARITDQVILRFYAWEVPTLSLGYHQQLTTEQIDRCQAKGIPIVRRPTGGRAVLHDRELTYALVIPIQHPLLLQGREGILRGIGEAFVAAGNSIGLPAELVRAGDRRRKATGTISSSNTLCFDSVSRWEVRLSGQKWIGSAQRFLPEAFLQHGSILTGSSQVNLAQLLGLPENPPGFEEGSIDEVVLRQVIPARLSKTWNLAWQEENLSPIELAEIHRLIEVRMHH